MEFLHKSVLLEEAIDGLNVKPDGIYVDGTAGGGGHSLEIVKKLDKGMLIAVDRDEDALVATKARLAEYQDKYTLVHSNYKDLQAKLDELNIDKIDGLLLDLGVSSYQLDEGERGFSYMQDAPLDMRMDRSSGITAYTVVNTYPEEELANLFYNYGEEKLSRKIANRIVREREEKPIETTLELANLIVSVYPKSYQGGHPAKRVFQALRIEVNGELQGLREFIEEIALRLNVGGRIAIITFHSLEDRVVKQAYKYLETSCICPPTLPVCVCGKRQEVKILTNKPIIPSQSEIIDNKRAASAKLRIAERI